MNINVTQEHIDNGRPGKSYHCAIALAINEAYESKNGFAIVGPNTVLVQHTEITLPNIAKDFMEEFDSGEKVEPIWFPLDYVKQ